MKKVLLSLVLASFSLLAMEDIATLGQAMTKNIGQALKKIYETYYSSTKTTQEIVKAVTHDLEKTYLGTLPLDVRKELIKFAATDEFKKLFFRIESIYLGMTIRLRTTPPDYDYVNFLLELGADPSITISKSRTALDIIDGYLRDLANLHLDKLLNEYKALHSLIKSKDGKKYSEL